MNNSISKSLFSIINKGGDFVSAKQAAFMNSQAFEGVITVRNTLTFGEWEGRTSRNTKTITFEFFVNASGVQKVVKLNSKNEQSLYWDRSHTMLAKFSAKVNKKQAKQLAADKANQVSRRLDELTATKKALSDKVVSLMMAGAGITPEVTKLAKVINGIGKAEKRLTDKYEACLKAFDAL